ncbi:MAG: hypothetical protein HXY40_00975 [Chloroflexi bacterium]|nr:hypothetical protein [Chloroflexota bacterium]
MTTQSHSDTQPLTDAERNAMRAYLQRCEVRLSTLHRIATAFISGAGIIVLIPVFFKDVVSELMQVLLRDFGPTANSAGLPVTLAMYVALAYVLFLLLFLPLRALYLTFKDIIDFYFAIHFPGFPETLENPTFALTGVTFSSDESPRVKREVLRYQYQKASIDFTIPFSKGKRREYFDSFDPRGITYEVQTERIPSNLRAAGLVAADVTEDDVRHFNAAMAIARTFERDLVQEVAKTEMSITRHILYLRRIVLRYVKTILLFIWTLMVLFGVQSVIKAALFPEFVMLALGCLLWSLPMAWLIHTPIEWIYRPITGVKDPTVPHDHRAQDIFGKMIFGPNMEKDIDPQLVVMERAFRKLRNLGVLASLLALVLALVVSA